MSSDARVVPVGILEKINRSSIDYGFNRTIEENSFAKIDGAMALVIPLMVHQHAGGVIHEKPQMRCEIAISVNGIDKPLSVYLDIEMEMFNSLPKYEDFVVNRDKMLEKEEK